MSDDPKPPAGAGRYSGAETPTRPVEKADIIEGLLRSMQREMQEGFNRITTDQNQTNAEVARLKSTIHMVVDNQKALGERVGTLESRVTRASGNLRAVKVSDDEQGQALTSAQEKNEALEQELSSMKQRHDSMVGELSNVTGELARARQRAEESKAAAEEAKAAAEEAKTAAEKAIAVAEKTKTVADDTKALAVSSNAELKEQTATLNRLAKLADHPVVKELVRVGAIAFLTTLLGLLAGGHK